VPRISIVMRKEESLAQEKEEKKDDV